MHRKKRQVSIVVFELRDQGFNYRVSRSRPKSYSSVLEIKTKTSVFMSRVNSSFIYTLGLEITRLFFSFTLVSPLSRSGCLETGSASDWCALREALYKMYRYNTTDTRSILHSDSACPKPALR